MINSFRRSILLLVFCFYIHGFSNSLAVSDCFQFWKMSLVVWLWDRRIPITPEKRAEYPIATLAVEIAEAKVGLKPKEGKLKVEPLEERR